MAHWVRESPDLRAAAGHAAGQHPDHTGSLLPDLVINGRITWQSRNNFRWRAILPLLLAMVAGVVPGTWLLRFSLPWIIKTVLGGVVVFLGLEMATRRLRPIRPDRREIPWLRYLVAFFSGMCAGLFGINMFLVAYLQRTAKDYDEFKAAFASSFWVKTCSAPGCISAPGS